MNAIWAEFLPYTWLIGDLKRLQERGLQLNLAIPAGRRSEPGLKELLRAAQAEGVPIGAWLLLADSQGYWPNAENAEAFCAAASAFCDWLAAEQLQVAEIIVDMETPLALSRLLKGQLLKGLQVEWKRWQSPLNAERFRQATERFTAFVSEMHARGLQVQVVTYPFLLHDAAAGNTAFQEFLQVPVTPVPWDRISLMVYRSSFQDVAPMPLSSWLVWHYLGLAREVLSVPVIAALGVIGSIGKIAEGGCRDLDEIRKDISAARAAGVETIQLFSLDGMHQLWAPDPWLNLLHPHASPAQTPSPLPGDQLLINTLQRAHAVLSGLDGLAPSKRS